MGGVEEQGRKGTAKRVDRDYFGRLGAGRAELRVDGLQRACHEAKIVEIW